MSNQHLETKIEDLEVQTRRLRAAVKANSGELKLQSLLRDIDSIVHDLHEHLTGDEVQSAVDLLQAALRLDREFSSVMERWAEVRREVGIRAADEVLRDLSPEQLRAAWSTHWKGLIDHAWNLRQQYLDRGAPQTPIGRPQIGQTYGRASGRLTDPRDSVRTLDLRYGANRPLTSIAEFLNLSTAAVQLRINTFQQEVALGIVHDAILSSMPSGWEFMPPQGAPRHSVADFILRETPIEERNARTVLVDVLPFLGDEEGHVGRPRAALGTRAGARYAGPRRIWALLFGEDVRPIFVPQSLLLTGGEPGEVTAANIMHMAVDKGVTDFALALDIALEADQVSRSRR